MDKHNTKLMRALRGEKYDGVPFWEVWYRMDELTSKLLNHPMTQTQDQIDLAKIMGWDYVIAGVPARYLGSTHETASDGTSHYVQGGKISLEDVYALPEPDYAQHTEVVSEVVKEATDAGLATIAYLPWCFHAVNTALGLEHLSYLVYDEPEYLHALMDWVEEGNRKAIEEIIIPTGVDAVLFDGDCAYKSGLMLRPNLFRELVFDRTAQTVAPLKDANIPYTLHSDGKADELLPILIELGFSAFHGVEAAANDLGDIVRRFGKDITLIGNMDVVFMTHATVDEVRVETEKMIRTGLEGGRYIAACNTSPLDYIPHENYLAMVDVIKNF